MVKTFLKDILNYLNLINIPKTIDIEDTNIVTKNEFYFKEKVFISENFVAGYTRYNNKNYIIVNKDIKKEKFKESVFFHECMHLVSQKEDTVGIAIKNKKFINLNEGANEIAAYYVYSKIYNKKYIYCKGYNTNRIICEYIVDKIYNTKEEFLKDYLLLKPYEFYKKILYKFNINNLLEFNKLLNNIYFSIESLKTNDIYEIYDIISIYLKA